MYHCGVLLQNATKVELAINCPLSHLSILLVCTSLFSSGIEGPPTFEMVVRVLDDPDHYVLVLAGGGEQLAAVGELHAPDGAEVRRLQLLRELDVLKVEGAALVRLDPLEAQGVVPALGVRGLKMDFRVEDSNVCIFLQHHYAPI